MNHPSEPQTSPLPPSERTESPRESDRLPSERGAEGADRQPESGFPDLLRCEEDWQHPLKRALLLAGAVLCIALGVVGWLVPVVTGIPFYIAGLVLAAKALPSLAHRVNAWERRLPAKWRRRLRPSRRHGSDSSA